MSVSDASDMHEVHPALAGYMCGDIGKVLIFFCPCVVVETLYHHHLSLSLFLGSRVSLTHGTGGRTGARDVIVGMTSFLVVALFPK